MKPKKTIYNWLTSGYLLIIRNEENFAEKTTLSFNYARLILFIIIIFSILLTLSFYLSSTLLARWFDPRSRELEINKKLVELSLSVDSLENEVQKKEMFIQSFKKVLKNDYTLAESSKGNEKSEEHSESKALASIGGDALSPIDDKFRKEFEKNSASFEVLKKRDKREDALQSIFFLAPVKGMVMSGYNSKSAHFGVDVGAPENEPIKAVAEGTVILSSWTQDSGYVIAIQHKNNIITFYKHNSSLLKKVGDFVKAGDIVSIIGNTGELTNGQHLHFELWYDGHPVDPQDFITF